jgi:hypothetical protein
MLRNIHESRFSPLRLLFVQTLCSDLSESGHDLGAGDSLRRLAMDEARDDAEEGLGEVVSSTMVE